MKVHVVQFDIRWEDKPANLARVRELREGTLMAPGGLIVLPEMFATGFTMDVARMAEEVGGPTETFVQDLARDTGCVVLAGFVTQGDHGLALNQAVAFDPSGRELVRYTKMHPFSYAGEQEHYAAGDEAVWFDWAGFRIAPLICYDLRFPEVYRQVTRQGAEVLVTIANFPSSRAHHWKTLNLARAIENQAFVLAVNRCGADPKAEYAGGSLVIDPRGGILAEAGAGEAVISATLDRQALIEYRERFPALRDMRPDLFAAAQRGASRE